jgi:cytochrome c-type biogenesis protein CcmH/NrfF
MTRSANSHRYGALLATVLFGCTGIAGVFVPTAQSQQTDRAKQIGGKFMCMCSCNQVLTQCNHVGCTTSASMLKELDQKVAQGDSEQAITQAFVQEFGTTVYAEPPKSGLSLVAWAMPSIYLLLGTGVVILVISRWRQRNIALATAHSAKSAAAVSPELLARARAQTAEDTED